MGLDACWNVFIHVSDSDPALEAVVLGEKRRDFLKEKSSDTLNDC